MSTSDEELCATIAATAIAHLPVDDWRTLVLTCHIVRQTVTLHAAYTTAEGPEPRPFDADNRDHQMSKTIAHVFGDLRRGMYERDRGRGAWFTATLSLERDGAISLKCDRDTRPTFKYEPHDKEFVRDLAQFPRDPAHMPGWLRDIVAVHKD
jgi:hypothetical protein